MNSKPQVDLSLARLSLAPGSPLRPITWTLGIAALLAVGPWSLPAAGAPAAVGQVAERGEQGLTFTVSLDGLTVESVEQDGNDWTVVKARDFGLTSEPGLPMLPFRTFTVALPPDADPVASLSILESESIAGTPAPAPTMSMEMDEDGLAVPGAEYRADVGFYGSSRTYPTSNLEVGGVSFLRRQRIAEITVYPVQFDAGTNTIRVARRFEVRVDFQRRSNLSGTRLPARGDEPGFEQMYRQTLVNYDKARTWRVGPRADRGSFSGSARLLANDAWKIEIERTGVVSVPFSAFTDFPSNVPVADIFLEERRYVDAAGVENFVADPVPVEIVDNGNNVFDAGDFVRFFGRNHVDRFGDEPYLNRYTERNVVWLSWMDGGGARVVGRTGWQDFAAPTVPASFPDVMHFEENYFNYDYAPRFSASPVYRARERVRPWYMVSNFPRVSTDCNSGDPYCVLERVDGRCTCISVNIPFEIWGLDTSSPITLRTRMVAANDGFVYLGTFGLINGNSVETTVADRWSFSGHLAIGDYESTPIPATTLTEGGNTFKFVGERFSPSNPDNILRDAAAQLDWFQIAYEHLYEAHNNRLDMTSGTATGDVEFRVDGFTSSDIVVYDVTDPTAVARLTDTRISDAGGGRFEVRFQDTIASERRYVAFVDASGELAPAAVAADASTNLASPGVEPDLIIIAHDDFVDECQRLKDYRESQGHTVELASITDVYDEFDGGLRRAFAIRNYMRHAFREWTTPPMYLLLVGDANEDYKDFVDSGLNLVPSQLFYGPVTGDVDLEIISTDTWYVTGLAPEEVEFDTTLDMHVGRFPVQTAEELTQLIDKVIAYENFDPSERWRARTLTICDDAWSSTISFNAPYQYRRSEDIFCAIGDSLNAMVQNEYDGLIEPLAWRLSTFSDQLPEEGRFPGTTKAHIDTTGLPILYQQISQGNLLMSYQGHANKHILAHERIFGSETDGSHLRFDNVGRPTLWFLFACHPNELDEFNERVEGVVGGRERATGELLITKENSGLIGSLASTGFEWLPSGLGSGPPYIYDLNTPVWNAFFKTPPVQDVQGRDTGARWILGEVTTLAKTLYNQQDTFKGPIFSYMLLGDPALKIDAIPPRFDLYVDTVEVEDGATISINSAGSDSVTVEAVIEDEVRIAAIDVFEVDLDDGSTTPVDASRVVVEMLGPDAAPERRVRATLRMLIRPDSYDLLIRARDASGRETEQRLSVRTTITLAADGVTIKDGDFIGRDARVTAEIVSPVPLTADGIVLGVIEEGTTTVQPLTGRSVQQQDTLGKEWIVAGDLNVVGGRHALAVQIEKNGVQGIDFRPTIQTPQANDFALRQVAAFPNPFERLTTINYQLTNVADRVDIKIFTISGRLVREIDGARNAGYSQIPWDGRDEDGDEVANGVYVYKINAAGLDREDEFIGKIVRSRR